MQRYAATKSEMSRLVIEIIIATGLLTVSIGVLQKLFHLGSVYEPHLMGLTPKDFIAFGIIAFLLATAIASRRMLKHLEILVAKK